MKVLLYSKDGKKKKEVVLNPEIFSARINKRLLELIRNAFAANLRRGTHKTKTRREVRGGGKKPWKQKGTGRARAGSNRSPIWRGGGTVFGPQPRSYFVNLPQTMKRSALVSALSLKGEQKNILLLEDAKFSSPKTKEWVQIFKSLPLDGKRALCVVKDLDDTIRRISRNYTERVEVEAAKNVNAYHILQREKLVIEEDALSVIEQRLSGQSASAASEVKEPVKAKKVVKKKKSTKSGSES